MDNQHTGKGSRKMYRVKFYKGNYRERQYAANRDGAICYVEQHFNSWFDERTDFTVVITGSNASRTSKNWGRWYAKAICREFGTPLGGDDGIKVGGYGGRGNGNIYYTRMPAILLEPLFASNPKHADIIRSEDGQDRLARVLVESIREFFPGGGLVAFSVGHKYKRSRPKDRGAALYGGGTEADYAEIVLLKAKEMLELT